MRPASGRRRFACLVLCLVSLSARAQDATTGNFGGAGLIETRTARFHPDGTLEAGTSFRHQRQFWFLNFQALPGLEATFRLTDRLNGTTGHGTTTDRAFDLKWRVWEESAWRPALALGLQDAIGTGIYGGEYLVASKRVHALDFSLGLGWGRLGTGADLENPLGLVSRRALTRPRRVGQGGAPAFGSFFRGQEAAVFAGVAWALPPVLGVAGLTAKLEYAGDALRDERGGYPARTTGLRGVAASRFNLGLEWQPDGQVDAGIFFVQGTDLLLRVSLRLDAAHPPQILPRPPPPAMAPRPAAPPEAPEAAAEAALRRAGFTPLGVAIQGAEARLDIAGGRQPTLAGAANRAARAVQPHLPADVELLRVTWHRAGAPIASLALPRAALERAATGEVSAEEVLASGFLTPGAPLPAAVPTLDWAAEPRLALQLGEPRAGIRWQAGAAAGARLGLGHGVALAGSLAQPIAGNLDRALPSDSRLAHVRSDLGRYARAPGPTLPSLYAERVWTPAPDVFARVTAGLLEPMFGGAAGEVLWRPQDRPFALGLDLAWVAQRGYGQRLGTLGYSVVTGHAALYADLPVWNLTTVLRAGRYLAGDWGGTIELSRRFASGIEVGAFATITDVPARRFGEGSFDKGIFLRFPLQLLGPETTARANAVIRPVIRDGGQRLNLDSPLWEVTRDGRVEALGRGYADFTR